MVAVRLPPAPPPPAETRDGQFRLSSDLWRAVCSFLPTAEAIQLGYTSRHLQTVVLTDTPQLFATLVVPKGMTKDGLGSFLRKIRGRTCVVHLDLSGCAHRLSGERFLSELDGSAVLESIDLRRHTVNNKRTAPSSTPGAAAPATGWKNEHVLLNLVEQHILRKILVSSSDITPTMRFVLDRCDEKRSEECRHRQGHHHHHEQQQVMYPTWTTTETAVGTPSTGHRRICHACNNRFVEKHCTHCNLSVCVGCAPAELCVKCNICKTCQRQHRGQHDESSCTTTMTTLPTKTITQTVTFTARLSCPDCNVEACNECCPPCCNCNDSKVVPCGCPRSQSYHRCEVCRKGTCHHCTVRLQACGFCHQRGCRGCITECFDEARGKRVHLCHSCVQVCPSVVVPTQFSR